MVIIGGALFFHSLNKNLELIKLNVKLFKWKMREMDDGKWMMESV